MKKIALTSIAACCMALGATGAHAGQLEADLSFSGTPVTTNITAIGYGLAGGNITGSTQGGGFSITPTGLGWSSYYMPGSFYSFCVELGQHVAWPNPKTHLSDYSIKSSTSAGDYSSYAPGQAFATISTTQLDNIGKLIGYASDSAQWGSSAFTDGSKSAALQAGIWEIVFEPADLTAFNLATGNFYVNAGVLTPGSNLETIQGYAALAKTYTGYQQYQVLWSASQQDMIVPVPEPEGYALALAGMAMVAVLGRRRQRRA